MKGRLPMDQSKLSALLRLRYQDSLETPSIILGNQSWLPGCSQSSRSIYIKRERKHDDPGLGCDDLGFHGQIIKGQV